MQAKNIYDLTARECACAGSPHAELLIATFKAIVEKKLSARFDVSPSILTRTGVTWPALARQAVFALERDPHFYVSWFRMVMIDPTDYKHWRHENSKTRLTTQPARKNRANDKNVLKGMNDYVDGERAIGRNPSQKRAWVYAKEHMPSATYQQVVTAMRKAEGGPKRRGRPRAAKTN